MSGAADAPVDFHTGVDVAFRPPICNNGKTTYPRLVYVPDGKPQHKVPFSRLPSAAKK